MLSQSLVTSSYQVKQINFSLNQASCIPNEEDMNQYLKKTYLQTYDFNDHIDKVRRNYLNKQKIKQQQQSRNQQVNKFALSTNSSIFLSQNKNKLYLQILQELPTETNLPQQIKENKLLCNLYKKLDSLENNWISEHQKQMQQKRKNHQILEEAQKDFTQQQKQFIKGCNTFLQQSKLKINQKKQQLFQLKANIFPITEYTKSQINPIFSNQYISQLINQTQLNYEMIQKRLDSLQQSVKLITHQKSKNMNIQKSIQQVKQSIKQLICENQSKSMIFM